MPCRNGLRPKRPEEGWLATPGLPVDPGVPKPDPGVLGLVGEGLDGVLGAE